jgi:arginyl-tRNA synthetase
MEWTAARLQAGMAEAFGEEYRNRDPMLTAATRPEFGDYQCNAVLPLAKLLSRKPRDAANELLGVLRLGGVFQEPTVTGPGFINLRLRPEFVVAQLEHMVRDKSGRLGIAPTQDPQRIVVDFSSPNIAKEMHVGHLRSTIIGDTLSRVLEFRGHHVLRLNHVGDWGTQFGMLITYLREHRPEALREMDEAQKGASGLGIAEGSVAGAAGSASIDLGDLVELYKEAKKRFDSDEAFRTASRNAVVALQAGEETSMAAWRLLCETSRREFQKIYDILDVELEERGESFYNPFLPAVVGGLLAAGLAEESEGAQVVWLDGYKSREGNGRQPLIVQKSDGGYMYSTTDLVGRNCACVPRRMP